MTEAEWKQCADPRVMLARLGDRPGDRKVRLFAIACRRRVWSQFRDERSRRAIEVAERHADGAATDAELEAAANAAAIVADAERERVLVADRTGSARAYPLNVFDAAYTAAIPVGWWGGAPAFVAPNQIICEVSAEGEREAAAQCDIIRDAFANPSRLNVLDGRFLNVAVTSLARSIYERRAFDEMPRIAELLEQSGCADQEVLAHCCGPGPHVRGCWVVDLVLGNP